MRKLSCKWPVTLTLLAFAMPAFYILHRLGKPEIFSAQELAVKALVASIWTIIAWSVYGVACLLASPKSEEVHKVALKDLEGSGEWDVEKLREKVDKIIDGSLKVDNDVLLDLSFVLRMKQAKEGEPEHKRDLERIEQLLQLSAEEDDQKE